MLFNAGMWCSAGYVQPYGIYLLIFQSALRLPTFKSSLMCIVQ